MKLISAVNGPVRNKLAWSIAAAISLSAGAANLAYAQDEEAAALEEITVTGSRIRRDDFSNPQPTTVVGGDMLENLGIVNLGDAMANLPSNVGNNTPTANPGGNFFNGSNIANLRGLNPFFGSRTLTLVDSRRHVPTNQGDGVDLNFIPSILIDRMEVVTGGASASYGSGAIGGVTNILLDRDLEGGKVQVDFGRTAESDGDDVHYGLAWGTAIGDNSHFVIGYEAQDMDPILSCAQARDWCAEGVAIQTNAGYATNADPNFVIVPDSRTNNMNQVGMFPLLGQTFTDASGTALRPFVGAGQYSVGGEGRHVYEYSALRSNVDRETVYATFTHDFSEDLGMFIEASFGSVDTYSPQGSLDLNFGSLAGDNYYLNNLPVNPCATFPGPCFFNKDFTGQATTANETSTDLERWAIGFNGSFGDTTWTWDAYYQFGESDRNQNVLDNRHARAFDFALDAVPSVPGDYTSPAVCRITRDGAAAYPAGHPLALVDPRIGQGCVPINIFGTNNITPAAFDYAFGQLLENTVVEQDIIEAVASGEVFEGFGAGPVRAAIGASWRDESIANIADTSQPDYQRTDYLIQYGESFAGDVEVIEYFTEVDIPVTNSFGVVGAIRRSEYTNTGGLGTGRAQGQSVDVGITTWKVNANWEVNDLLALRASQSRDVRAPNFRELYYGQVIPAGPAFGFCSNPWTGNINLGFFTNTGDPCIYDLHGGLGLTPEEADTTTVGFILSPDDWNVRFAADWYQIEITDAITPANIQLVIDGCEARSAEMCSLIEGTLLNPADPLGGFSDIGKVSPEARNFRGYKSRGVDLTADWVGEFDFGTISTRLIASRVLEQTIQPTEANPSLVRDIAGVVGSTNGFLADWASAPDWTAQLIATYISGPYTVTTQGRWVKEGDVYADRFGPNDSNYNPNAANSIADNSLPNYFVWSLSGSYDFSVADTEMSVFGTINNLFDKDPPISGVGVGGTSSIFYDTIGRSFRIGLRATF
jgi:outer membrane receptor protein involved in Fe transport